MYYNIFWYLFLDTYLDKILNYKKFKVITFFFKNERKNFIYYNNSFNDYISYYKINQMSETSLETNCVRIRKDHFMLLINNVNLGVFERSELRHIIEVVDNAI